MGTNASERALTPRIEPRTLRSLIVRTSIQLSDSDVPGMIRLNTLAACNPSVEIAMEIAKESAVAQRMGLRSIPFIFINNKLVHRWNKDGLLDAIFSELSE